MFFYVVGNLRRPENSAFQKYPALSVSKVQPEPQPMEYIFVEELSENASHQETVFVTTNQHPMANEGAKSTNTPRKLPTIQKNTKTPVKILPKTLRISPNVTPTKIMVKPMNTSIRFSSSPAIEKFSTAWRCVKCKKIISTKKAAMDHLKIAHQEKN